MKELSYFAFAGLMVKIEYDKKANSLRYASHRQMKFQERIAVEQYILTAIAPRTAYYKKQPARFTYLGVDGQLVKYLNMFHSTEGGEILPGKEKEINDSIHGLIRQSMEGYYFDKIGDAILSIRRELAYDRSSAKVVSLKKEIQELIAAFNLYSRQEIKIDDVIPEELQCIFNVPYFFATNPWLVKSKSSS